MFDSLIRHLLDGDYKQAIDEVNSLLAAAVPREEIVASAIEETMSYLDEKCTVQHFNLLEIMLVGRAVMEVIKILYPQEQQIPVTKGTIAVVALEGDVHDIGKNIVKIVLTSHGYKVIDCGKDCQVHSLLDILKKEQPMAVGVAGLIPTVVPHVQSLRSRLDETGLEDIKVVVGGGALRQMSAAYLKVDAVMQSVFELDRYLEHLGGNAGEQS